MLPGSRGIEQLLHARKASHKRVNCEKFDSRKLGEWAVWWREGPRLGVPTMPMLVAGAALVQ